MAQVTMLLSSDSDEVMEFIKRLGFDPGAVKRVVVDICVAKPVTVYVEMYASAGSLEIITNAPEPPEIKVVE